MRSPVALIIFNRPDVTSRVAEMVAKAGPSQLFVLADGPRPDRPGEAEKCAATRATIEQIDWPCEVIKKYSDVNLGCGLAPASGIDWVFEQTDRAIILEDDCLPHSTFFRYCDDLLELYRDDERIMQIAGSNFQCDRKYGTASYFLSRFKICWGWATWRRAWQHMDMSVKQWPQLRNTSWLTDLAGDARAAEHWATKFEDAYRAGGSIDYWDYQWLFATWVRNGLCIMPNVNLVSNIGFGEDATHTTWAESRWANLPLEEMLFPLQHPSSIARDKQADDFFVQEVVLTDASQPQNSLGHSLDKVRHAYAAAVPETGANVLAKIPDTSMTQSKSPNSLSARAWKRLAWTWVNFWLARCGRGKLGRIAAGLAAWGYPPYKGRLELARIQSRGYIASSARISHANLKMGNNIFMGDRVVIYQHEGGGPVELGDRAVLFDEIIVETFPGGSLRIGADTAVQPRCHFTAAVAPIRIGNGVQIAPQCAFYSYDHGIAPGELVCNQPLQSKGPIIIEDDAWLGFGVIVLSGVRIGKGAVIGAGSVVTHDVPEDAVAVGSPAQVVKMRRELSASEQVHFQGAAR